jgi:hypothetical protein
LRSKDVKFLMTRQEILGRKMEKERSVEVQKGHEFTKFELESE